MLTSRSTLAKPGQSPMFIPHSYGKDCTQVRFFLSFCFTGTKVQILTLWQGLHADAWRKRVVLMLT
jgi:hypothetical protein